MSLPPDLKDRVAALERCLPDIPAAFHQLFSLLPKPGENFPIEERVAFVRAVAALADVVYGVARIRIESVRDGTPEERNLRTPEEREL